MYDTGVPVNSEETSMVPRVDFLPDQTGETVALLCGCCSIYVRRSDSAWIADARCPLCGGGES